MHVCGRGCRVSLSRSHPITFVPLHIQPTLSRHPSHHDKDRQRHQSICKALFGGLDDIDCDKLK